MPRTPLPPESRASEWVSGGGEAGKLIREKDWSHTPLGPVSSWSLSLRMMVRFLLANRFPLLLWWGPQFCQLYNDPYRPVLGEKHPRSMGQPAQECWKEIWHVIGPLIESIYRGGPPTWMDDLSLEINRYGFPEETHFAFAYSPVPDDTASGEIGGVLATVYEISEKVVGERRVMVLRDLGSLAAAARTADEACAAAAETVARHPLDVPFALLYLLDPDLKSARLAGSAGVRPGNLCCPEQIDLVDGDRAAWPLAEVLATGSPVHVADLGIRFPGSVPHGPWSDPPHEALALPIWKADARQLTGFFVSGISSRLRLDDPYSGFLGLATSQIATSIASAVAYEEEKRRAEALAELDLAKTAFFSNVSHEFRTPLALMLGPLEDALSRADGGASLGPDEVALVHRNGLRLLKLVNTLLDFSRIEAGRVQAVYQLTDLGALTSDLASTFRSAIERAGLQLIVDCDGVEPVYVDREMWEKIVLNLLSNAFKYTFEGRIEVRLRTVDDAAELVVRDTGIGIPAEELPRVFERFHRVSGARGRSFEGSGIGLALVRELIRYQGGSVRVTSKLGQGTEFVVSVPRGKSHVPAGQIRDPETLVSAATGAEAFVQEALRWLPDAPVSHDVEEVILDPGAHAGPSTGRPDHGAARILVADDNADLREYLRRLLEPHYAVETVTHGEEALRSALQHPPDLVLSDVMMPRLDGFGLLKALRQDERTAMVPVILLSARAGEESRIEGMQAGADDYLTKPFSARELLARVGARLEIARLRRETDAEHRVAHEALAASEDALRRADRKKDEFLATLAHELRNPLAPIRNASAYLKRIESGDTKLAWARDMIDRHVEHMARLLDDLMDVTRVTQGRMQLHKERVIVADVIEQALESCRALIEEAGHHLTVSDPSSDLWVEADPIRLSQVLSNLLHNAVKYTPRGGRIAVSARAEGGEIVLSVKDNGIGIEPGHLPRVFEIFAQAAPALERSEGGLGIGLSLVRGIVDAHGGRVEAKSDGINLGSEFVVRLPLGSPGSSAPSRSEDEGLGSSFQPLRILVVEDNRDSAESLLRLLRMDGHEVEMAHDGLTATSIAERVRPDAILLDIGLPGRSGYEVAKIVRHLEWGKGVLLVALTGWGQERDRRLAQESGFDHHLIKPVEHAALRRLLRKPAKPRPPDTIRRGEPAASGSQEMD
jgi:signal transduction histidine kinase